MSASQRVKELKAALGAVLNQYKDAAQRDEPWGPCTVSAQPLPADSQGPSSASDQYPRLGGVSPCHTMFWTAKHRVCHLYALSAAGTPSRTASVQTTEVALAWLSFFALTVRFRQFSAVVLQSSNPSS